MARVHIETRKPETLAYLERTGTYETLPFATDIPKLYAWARSHKLRPGMAPLARFLDAPGAVPPEKRRTRIAIPVRGDAHAEGEVGVEALPAMEVATVVHNGPAREYPRTYAALRAWTEANGYEWAGPPIERYKGKPKRKGGELTMKAKVQVPVRRKGAA